MAEKEKLSVLLAPFGQLSGDGQLRESFSERRDRRGSDYPMWYLTPELVKELNISNKENHEAVVAEEALAIAWLKLRFGGQREEISLDRVKLWEIASDPPPAPERRDIGMNKKTN
tara:strand:- start:38 stop:382 length:345 start_codon:yes stop_codon:yes gene_type:complete